MSIEELAAIGIIIDQPLPGDEEVEYLTQEGDLYLED